jgi:hypothetical protein
MTNDPFQIVMFILLIAAFPLIIWVPTRITELMALGEEERVPEALRLLANERYLEAVYEGQITPKKSHRRKIFVAIIGLVFPIGMLCTTTSEIFIPGLMLILVSAMVFFLGVAVLEWLVRPRNQ